jgi:hypothetical protein
LPFCVNARAGAPSAITTKTSNARNVAGFMGGF